MLVLCSTLQSKDESIANWASKVDTLQGQLREAVSRVLLVSRAVSRVALVIQSCHVLWNW